MARLYLKSPPEVAEAIGARAQALRRAQGLSQTELAERAGVGRRTLQRFEDTGNIAVEAMIRIAFALGVPDSFDALFPPPARKSLDELLQDPLEKRRRKR